MRRDAALPPIAVCCGNVAARTRSRLIVFEKRMRKSGRPHFAPLQRKNKQLKLPLCVFPSESEEATCVGKKTSSRRLACKQPQALTGKRVKKRGLIGVADAKHSSAKMDNSGPQSMSSAVDNQRVKSRLCKTKCQ